MANNEFDGYNLGSVVGQTWEGGTVTGSGKWSASKWGPDPQPDPQVIADPTGLMGGNCLKIATVVPAGTSLINAPQYAQYAVFNPADYIYHFLLNTANTTINLNFIMYLPDVKSKIFIGSNYPLGSTPPLYQCPMPGTSAATGKMYPNGQTWDLYGVVTPGMWIGVNLVVDLTLNNDLQYPMVSAQISNSTVAAQYIHYSNIDQMIWPYLYIGIHGSIYADAANYMLIDRIFLTGVSTGPAGKVPPRRGPQTFVSGVTSNNITVLPSAGWGY